MIECPCRGGPPDGQDVVVLASGPPSPQDYRHEVQKAPLLQDDGHRLQRFSRTADVMAILALQHQLQGQVYSLSTPESILMLRKGCRAPGTIIETWR